MRPTASDFFAALLLVEAVAGYVHLELKSSTDARRIKKRESGFTDIFHHPDTPWYYVDVFIGSNPQKIKLRLEDRGTTWLPWLEKIDSVANCSREYPEREFGELCEYASISGIYDPSRSNTFTNITSGPDLFVNYSGLETHGKFGSDTLQLNQLAVTNVTIGLATDFRMSPALGVGMPEDVEAYPYNSFLQDLEEQGKIKSLVYSLYLNDLYSSGDIYFGAIDESRFYGELRKFDNTGLVGHVPVNGVWWVGTNGTIHPLVESNRDDDVYMSDGSVSFGSTNIGVPQEIYDYIVDRFDVEEREGRWWLPCEANIDVGALHLAIGEVLYNITSRQLVSNENFDGDECYRFLAIEVTQDARENTPSYRLGDPFLRGTYAVFDYTNKQTLLAPAVVNATTSRIVEVGQNGALVQGTGLDVPEYLKDIPTLADDTYRLAPGTPMQPGSDPSQSKGIIVGGLLGGIIVLVLVLGAVYAIRPRSQRSRDIASWFTFMKPKPSSRKSSADPVIAYPARHDSKYYQAGTTRSRITPVSYPPEPENGDTQSPTSLAAANGNGDLTSPERSYYASTAFRPARLPNVAEGAEGMEMATPYQQANRYGYTR